MKRRGQMPQGNVPDPYILQWAANILKVMPLPEPTRILSEKDGGFQIEWTSPHKALLIMHFRPRHELAINFESGGRQPFRRNLTTNFTFLTRVLKLFTRSASSARTNLFAETDPTGANVHPTQDTVDRSAKMLHEAAARASMAIDRDVRTRSGSRVIAFINGRRHATLECDEDGDIVGTLSDRSVDEEADTWVVDSKRIDESLARIEQFLRGEGGQASRR